MMRIVKYYGGQKCEREKERTEYATEKIQTICMHACMHANHNGLSHLFVVFLEPCKRVEYIIGLKRKM